MREKQQDVRSAALVEDSWQVMVCEEHPWRVWPDGDPQCSGRGMPLSNIERLLVTHPEFREAIESLISEAWELTVFSVTHHDRRVARLGDAIESVQSLMPGVEGARLRKAG